jgi:ABC-2 type transport system permease protein
MASEATMTVTGDRAAGRSSLSYLPWTIAAVGGSLIVLGLNLLLLKRWPHATVTHCLPALDFLWAFAAGFLLLAGLGSVRVLMGRELATYFQSPLAAIVAALYFIILSLVVIMSTSVFEHINPTADVNAVVGGSSFLMLLVAPIITMRLLAEEQSSQTMEILVTDPVTDWDIVLGKFLAAVLCLIVMVLPLGLYVALFAWMRKSTDPGLEWGVMASATVGLVCVLMLFASIGLFASALTKNQVVSALIGFVALMTLWIGSWLLPGLLRTLGGVSWGPKLGDIADSVNLYGRLNALTEGQMDLKSIFFFLSTTALVLYFSVRAVESRKWR